MSTRLKFTSASKFHVQTRKQRHTCYIQWHRQKDRAQIPTKFLSLNYSLRKYSFTNSRFSISFRGPKLWNEILNKEEKGLECHTLFKKCFKLKLLNMDKNEYSNF